MNEAGTNEPFLGQLLGDNPYFSAGFGLMALGAGLTVARRGFLQASQLTRRWLICDLEIASKDASYDWFLDFMAKQQRNRHSEASKMSKPSFLGRILKPQTRSFAVETTYKQHANGSITASFELVPGPGRHLVKWNDAYILMTRERSERLMDNSRNKPFETLKLQTLYTHKYVFNEMLKAAQQSAQQRQSGKTVMYTSLGPEWRQFGLPRRKRSLDSVILASGVKERLLGDIESFLDSQKWYSDRGVPYRRGYLLYGPPGSGKTSVIQALAGELDYNICILNLAEVTLTDDRLNHLLNNVPPRSFLLLEDVDSAFNEARKKNAEFGSGVTFSGLLNSLDGVTSAEERIVFMTTNHPERLDPALIRPGRVDFKALIDNATPNQVKNMFQQFYGPEYAEEFVELVLKRNIPVSTAQLQGLFIFHKGDPKGAIASFESITE
ncbi:bifunctional AAA family ATPase chaperone/translocase [Starmerella bacillaris]|uniref:Bifunctional AAA family ATPase chaperone/translocase n=1 Tax=Starmerella bacillaris TaxID=1247836 RepID=A0AAV5RKX3_STABA|nr:bifunctional AAA family ATPase chaperone/translocase [Starmerella bacillaris]